MELGPRYAEIAFETGDGVARPKAEPWPGGNGRTYADEYGGDARLAIRLGALDFPGAWEQIETALDELDAAAAWRNAP